MFQVLYKVYTLLTLSAAKVKRKKKFFFFAGFDEYKKTILANLSFIKFSVFNEKVSENNVLKSISHSAISFIVALFGCTKFF